MLYTLKNEELNVSISDKGGEVVSVKRGDVEYMWQADPTYWASTAPILFPICGRLFGGKYTYRGKEYAMNLHGFLRHATLSARQTAENELRFTLTSDEETKKIYPFDFTATVTYRLSGAKLRTELSVTNTGSEVLPAAFGGHPGFNVPLDGNGKFEDWYLEFGAECAPDEIVFSDTCFNTGKKRAFPLKDAKILPLNHHLFDIDAVFMSRIADTVTLKSATSNRFVMLHYPDMPYLGIWHKPQTEAPYVCIEPWCGLPSFDGEEDDFEKKSDMFRIPAGSSKTVHYSVYFG